MKRVPSSTPQRVLKTWMKSLIVFLLVISNASFTGTSFGKNSNGCLSKPVDNIQGDSLNSGFDVCTPYAALNYRMEPFLKLYIEEEGTRFKKMKVWGKKHLDMYERILTSYGLPVELKYLSVIESGLKSKAASGAGAVGPWQITAGEAIRMGLRVDSAVDERTQFRKSTHAAAKILKELYSQFNDWPLVIAAYNCGAGRVRKAIRKSGSRNFWHLNAYLPKETRFHVKRFIGTHFMFEGSGGLTTMTASEIKDCDLKVAEMQKAHTLHYGVDGKIKVQMLL